MPMPVSVTVRTAAGFSTPRHGDTESEDRVLEVEAAACLSIEGCSWPLPSCPPPCLRVSVVDFDLTGPANATVTRPPGGVNLPALVRRLPTTCVRRVASPSIQTGW